MENMNQAGSIFTRYGEVDDEYFKYVPPGWRFCPTDEELIQHYLANKVFKQTIPAHRIHSVNLYLYHPQDLTRMYTVLGEGNWYFFTPRDRKYPNGSRPNRAAGDGYWKPTGKDKSYEINHIKGKRKSLDYYEGKHPTGKKTNWKMHEYRLDKEIAPPNNKGETKLDDWVLCKVYKKAKSERDNNHEGAETVTSDEQVSVTDATSESEVNSSHSIASDSLDVHGNHSGATTSPVPNSSLGPPFAFYEPQQHQSVANYSGATTSTLQNSSPGRHSVFYEPQQHQSLANYFGATTSTVRNNSPGRHNAFYETTQQHQSVANYSGATTSTVPNNSPYPHYAVYGPQQHQSVANYSGASTSTVRNNSPGHHYAHYGPLQHQSVAYYSGASTSTVWNNSAGCHYPHYEPLQHQSLANYSGYTHEFTNQALSNHCMELAEMSQTNVTWERIGTQLETPNHITAVQPSSSVLPTDVGENKQDVLEVPTDVREKNKQVLEVHDVFDTLGDII